MGEICLLEAAAEHADAIEDYRAEFPSDMKLTYHAARIPGLSGLGIARVRIVCRDTNAASNSTIRSAGGVCVDSITGELSDLTVNRYDVVL